MVLYAKVNKAPTRIKSITLLNGLILMFNPFPLPNSIGVEEKRVKRAVRFARLWMIQTMCAAFDRRSPLRLVGTGMVGNK